MFDALHVFEFQIVLEALKRSRSGIVYCVPYQFSANSALAEAAVLLTMRPSQAGVVSIRVSTLLMVWRLLAPVFITAAEHTYAVPVST